METSVKITLIIVGALIFLGVAVLFVYSGQISEEVTVSSRGESVVKAMPDLLTIYFSIISEAETAQEARDKNSEIVENLITGLVENGLDRSQIVTESFNVNPNYRWVLREYKQEGYKANHHIKVQVPSDYRDSGKLIDAGVDAGANINYINFELSQEKQNEYKVEALKRATEDAKAKAQGIASGLGKSVGKVVSVSTEGFDYYPWRVYDSYTGASGGSEAKEAVTDIQPGERDVSGRVNVVFALK